MKILIDTNIIVDIALERQPFYTASQQVLSFVYQTRVEGYISASTFSDLYYIIRRTQGRIFALDFLKRIAMLCQIATVDRSVIDSALTAPSRTLKMRFNFTLRSPITWMRSSPAILKILLLNRYRFSPRLP